MTSKTIVKHSNRAVIEYLIELAMKAAWAKLLDKWYELLYVLLSPKIEALAMKSVALALIKLVTKPNEIRN